MLDPTATLPRLLEQSARKNPGATALIYFGAKISYGRLWEHVQRFATGLQQLGIKKGDRVALMMPNCPQFVIAYFGALRAGAIVTATSAIYTAREAAHQWNDAGIAALVADRRLLKVVDAALPGLASRPIVIRTGMKQYCPKPFQALCDSLRSAPAACPHPSRGRLDWEQVLACPPTPAPDGLAPADIACLQYTGGTTGTSKGAMLTHGNLVTNASQAVEWLGCREGQEISVASLPLFHIYAMTCVMISMLATGGAMIILPRFELKAALNAVRKYHPTIYHGVPTMYVAFNNAPDVQSYGFRSLRVCMSGGAPLPVEVRQRFQQLTGGRLVEGYGLTETSPVTHVNPLDGPPKVGSIGLPVRDTEARVVDLETGDLEVPTGEIGEIVIRGPQVMKGYWNKPRETDLVLRNGWLHTGDIAKKDEDGYFYIVDRKKDMIIAGGFNVYPREVEEVLFECPKVREAGVIGVPDDYRGETVKAFVVLKDGVTATAEEIIAFCRERLAPYKVPRIVVFRDSLPKSGVGKYLRRELRNL